MLTIYDKFDLSAASQHSGNHDEAMPIGLSGPPGTGKTSMFRSWCEARGYWLDSWGLSKTLTPDLGGMYVPNDERTSIEHIRTGRLLAEGMPDGYDKALILFDEFDKASQAQQGALCSYLEGRNVDGKKIPDHVIFGFTMNRKKDMCGGNSIIAPMRNRMWHIEIGSDVDRWVPIASQRGVNPLVIAFLSRNPSKLNQFDPQSKDMSYATERSWTKAGLMANRIDDVRDLVDVVSGIVGESNAIELKGFLDFGETMTPVQAIYDDPEGCRLPTQPDVCYAIICNLMHDFCQTEKNGEPIDRERAESVLTYFRRMDDAMGVFGFRMMNDCTKTFSSSTEKWSEFRKDYQGLMSV